MEDSRGKGAEVGNHEEEPEAGGGGALGALHREDDWHGICSDCLKAVLVTALLLIKIKNLLVNLYAPSYDNCFHHGAQAQRYPMYRKRVSIFRICNLFKCTIETKTYSCL